MSAECARRYRTLATTIAEPTFDRTLALGSTIRRAGRDPLGAEHELIAAVEELRQLLACSQAAITEVRASAGYCEAVAAFTAGAVERTVPLAIEVFTDVVVGDSAGVATWDVPLGTGPGGEHFVSPEECAARIAGIAGAGLPAASPPPQLGADDTITPVTLGMGVANADGPVTLAFEVEQLPGPICRLAHSTLALFYADRLHAPFTVRCVAGVTDEWWNVRPDAYAKWIEALGPLLQSQGLTMTMTP
ncbi:MAG: hypothetical protein ABIR79_04540 [Candidatus Binatia bacterium]